MLNLNFLQSDCLKVIRKYVRIEGRKWRVYTYLIIGQINGLEDVAICALTELLDDLEPLVTFLEFFLGMTVVHIS